MACPSSRLVLAAALGAALAGCDDGPADPAPDMRVVPRPPVDAAPTWVRVTVDEDAGLFPAIDARGERIGVAYWSARGREDGPCEAVGEPFPTRVVWSIRYAERGADGWVAETAHEPLLLGAPVGLDFAFAPDGTPTIAATVGPPLVERRYCGANDGGLITRGAGGWAVETVVSGSAEAASGEAASDFGDVVGYWPALAFDADGAPAMAWQDVHGGSLQGDDLTRADAEFAWRRDGGWAHAPVDVGRGAGAHNALVFDAGGRPVLLYQNPVVDLEDGRFGVWAARSADGGATWATVRLAETGTSDRLSLAVAPPGAPDAGALYAAWYDAAAYGPVVARLAPDAAFEDAGAWQRSRPGDPRFDEGRQPSLRFGPDGGLAVAWYRCARVAAAGDCDPEDDAVVFAALDGGDWRAEVVDAGDAGLCGMQPALAFDADGRPVVAYRCSRSAADGFVFRLDIATREAAP